MVESGQISRVSIGPLQEAASKISFTEIIKDLQDDNLFREELTSLKDSTGWIFKILSPIINFINKCRNNGVFEAVYKDLKKLWSTIQEHLKKQTETASIIKSEPKKNYLQELKTLIIPKDIDQFFNEEAQKDKAFKKFFDMVQKNSSSDKLIIMGVVLQTLSTMGFLPFMAATKLMSFLFHPIAWGLLAILGIISIVYENKNIAYFSMKRIFFHWFAIKVREEYENINIPKYTDTALIVGVYSKFLHFNEKTQEQEWQALNTIIEKQQQNLDNQMHHSKKSESFIEKTIKWLRSLFRN